MAKAGQNIGYKKTYFNQGWTPGSRNVQDILGCFLNQTEANKKARNVARNSKSKNKR